MLCVHLINKNPGVFPGLAACRPHAALIDEFVQVNAIMLMLIILASQACNIGSEFHWAIILHACQRLHKGSGAARWVFV